MATKTKKKAVKKVAKKAVKKVAKKIGKGSGNKVPKQSNAVAALVSRTPGPNYANMSDKDIKAKNMLGRGMMGKKR